MRIIVATWTLRALVGVLLLLHSAAWAATLEIPTPNMIHSGIGVIAGWKCAAEGDITIRLNGGVPIPAMYGLPRTDTRGVCRNDGKNGFFSYTNWGTLGDGTHTAVAYDDGQEFARSTFQVVTTGEEFLRGAHGTCEIPDFPAPGDIGHFAWNQSTQHLELVDVEWATPPAANCARWPETDAFADATPAWVRACLNAGVDVNAEYDRNGFTPLHSAAHHGNAPVVQVLLEAGADVTKAKSNGYAPLHAALVRAPAIRTLVIPDGSADLGC